MPGNMESAAAGIDVGAKVKQMHLGDTACGMVGAPIGGGHALVAPLVGVVESLVEGLKREVEMLSSPLSIPSLKIMADFK